jgi:hypothetical protein
MKNPNEFEFIDVAARYHTNSGLTWLACKKRRQASGTGTLCHYVNTLDEQADRVGNLSQRNDD